MGQPLCFFKTMSRPEFLRRLRRGKPRLYTGDLFGFTQGDLSRLRWVLRRVVLFCCFQAQHQHVENDQEVDDDNQHSKPG